MLSSNAPVPIHKFDFSGDGRRLSIHTAHGKTLTSHDGLPSPEHLTPITGNTPAMTPRDGSPTGSDTDSPMMSRTGSDAGFSAPRWEGQDGGELKKVNSRGGLWHDDVSICTGPGRSAKKLFLCPPLSNYNPVRLGHRAWDEGHLVYWPGIKRLCWRDIWPLGMSDTPPLSSNSPFTMLLLHPPTSCHPLHCRSVSTVRTLYVQH